MSIPISTTTITVRGVRPQSDVDPDAEGYDGPGPQPQIVASGINATITLPQGRRSSPTDEIDSYSLRCDLFMGVLSQYDTVTDDQTGVEYEVHTATRSLPEQFGLDHWVATIKRGKGIVSGGDMNESARV